jgi:hypothetical protein
MKKKIALVLIGCLLAATVALAQSSHPNIPSVSPLPPSSLFDKLGGEPDVVYLVANSSVVFGPDPHSRSEEVTFIGPVTVPKWPMKGYGRRVLPDGRQQIDIELTQSELTGESYVLGGPVILGEHPDLRSLGTITERPQAGHEVAQGRDDKRQKKNKGEDMKSKEKSDRKNTDKATSGTAANDSEEVPADFVVERKVLMTTAKGILYNETAVPVRGRIDSIPPIKFQGTPTGVNTFRGMELPVALLDKDGNVNGWFYSKAHMAFAVLPAAIERSYIKGTVQLRSGQKTENVEVSGPAEIHHLTTPGSGKTDIEVMVLALRGRSELLGGDIMFTETFSDRDHFSRGQLNWTLNNADAKFDLFIDLYTPSAKLTTHDPLSVSGQFVDCTVKGRLEKGRLSLPMMGGKGRFITNAARVLYDEAERPSVELTKMELNIMEGM